MKKAFLLIFLSLIVCSLCASNHVVELTEENFDSVLRQGKPALVKFFTSWCGFCKKLEPEWNTLADVIHEGGDKVIIAKLDCDKYSDLARKYAVQGYPTIKFFPNGPINHEPYDSNDRDADSFIEFLNENAGIRQKYLKPRKVIDVPANRFNKVLNDNSRAVLVAFYDPKDPNCLALAPIYDDLGKIFEKDDVVFVRFNSETYEAREIKRNFKITRYPAAFFFPKGRLASDLEHAIRYENLLIKDEMIRFLKVQLNSEGSSGRIKALDELVVRLIKGDKEAIPEAERVSSSFTGDQLKFSEIYIKYMKHYDQKDKDFAQKEIARVNKMLSNKNVVGGKVNEFLARLSILESFTQSN